MRSKLLLAALLCLALFTLSGCMLEKTDQYGNVITPTPAPTQEEKVTTEDITEGTGTEVKTGDTVKLHYVGTLTDGTKFDSSRDSGTPYTYTVGQEGIIQGWAQGIPGMKVGGTRRLTIPPSLGYGAGGYSDQIPPNATLIFEIELLEITQP